ncbi:sensor histidine kinase [Rugosimonospora acidiphila]|uniref:histidine kinase n=1 Tax=Rugosimonospora acidiphila TaxID=556531 RepID=A0ABP9SR24_9ACTN
MRATTVRQALTQPRLLASSWPWRACAYLVSGVPIGALTLLGLLTLVGIGLASAVIVIGIVLLGAVGLAGLPVAAVERWRIRLIDQRGIADPHRPPSGVGLRAWLARRYGEAATWRELAYALLLATVLWPLDLIVTGVAVVVPGALLATPMLLELAADHQVKVLKTVDITSSARAWMAVPLGVLALAAGLYVATAYGAVRASLVHVFLESRDETLARRLTAVTESRMRLVGAFDAERRRIERDLHDGAQQRLVALGMTIGLARVAEPEELPDLLDQAHTQAQSALEELRDLIRGVHPQILTDRGLPAAIADVADRSPVPVALDADLPDRLPVSVETTAYFLICEALTNVSKHSHARQVSVCLRMKGEVLVLDIDDDGVGGADPARGTGLTGLADRISVAGGSLNLSSPMGGPTQLRVELPCETI